MSGVFPECSVRVFAGDHGSNLQERDDQSGGDEQIPEDPLRPGLQLQDGADLQGLQHAALRQVKHMSPPSGPLRLTFASPVPRGTNTGLCYLVALTAFPLSSPTQSGVQTGACAPGRQHSGAALRRSSTLRRHTALHEHLPVLPCGPGLRPDGDLWSWHHQ